MKIAYDNQIFNMQAYGGISRYYTELADQLYHNCEDVKVYAGLHRNNYIDKVSNNLVIGSKINYLPKSASLLLMLNSQVANINMKKWKADIVHRTYYNKSTKIKSAMNVITVYDMIHELFPEDFSKKDGTSYLKEKAIKKSDHVICISESTKKDLIKVLNIPEDKISVVHLGYHANKNLKNKVLSRNKIYLDRPFLLFVGARGGYKNFKGMIEAISTSKALMQDFNIVAFGGGDFNAAEKNNIRELGFCSTQVLNIQGGDDILSTLYEKATLFIYPSLYEGFGLPPLEAMNHNCPVVCSNTSSIPEVVGAAALMFSPHDIDSIRQSIEKVVYDTEMQRDLINKGLIRIEKFSWEKCSVDTLEVYKSII